MTLRYCVVCGKLLSEHNKSPDRCFYHSLPLKEQKKLDAKPHGGPVLGSTSIVKTGFNIVTIDYHGGPKDL